jgi:hypothetical protein
MSLVRAAMLTVALSTTAAAPVPILRFAIDQDYTPQTESVARVAQDFPLVRALNISILRTGIGWDDTNPARNQYNWPYWSRVTSEATAQGITLRPYYAYTPSWAGAAYNSPPNNDRSYAKACAVMAAQLGPHVPSFEIWNEPDNPSFWTGYAAPFGAMLANCARAIHTVRPAAQVVQGGLLYLDSTFYAAMGAPALRDIDIAAYHEYTETPWDGTTVEQINSDADFNQGYDIISGGGRRPVWMDEGGASTGHDQGYDERTQASWIRRTVASVLGHKGRPIALIGLYQLRDPLPSTTVIGNIQAQRFFHHTGLFTSSGAAKLGAHTTADLVALLDHHRPDPQPAVRYVALAGQTSPSLRVYDFLLETGHQIVLIWDRHATSGGTITLPTPGRQAFLHNPDGTIDPVRAFAGATLAIPVLKGGDIPLLYEIR